MVRDGRLAPGFAQVAGVVGELWLLGSGLDQLNAVPEVTTRAIELGPFAPAAWAQWLAGELGEASVVLSAEPDGRDLAGRLAARLGVELHAGCLEVAADRVVTPRFGAATTVVARPRGRFVATVQPRASGPTDLVAPPVTPLPVTIPPGADAVVLEVAPPDLETVDLADAPRILAGGAGLEGEDDFTTLSALAPRLGAAMGATRVVTDRGWVPFRRQIGTTGVTVAPQLYVAFGISGAVQHTAGLGSPQHVVSVNLDAACPMSQMADVAIVADAHATLAALARRVGDLT
jgi:electron transfer flavoprotein alpha subunit